MSSSFTRLEGARVLKPLASLVFSIAVIAPQAAMIAPQAAMAGQGAAAAPANFASKAGSGIAAEMLTLGMPYVVPAHVPGSKVRTPEGLAPLLAERLGRELPLQAVRVSGGVYRSVEGSGDGAHVDALLVPLDAGQIVDNDKIIIPTGYRAGIMAIMRTDTDIRGWEDLRGRTVCLAEGSGLAGRMQQRWGAIEKVFRAPADALLDLRIGGCDAAVHDSTMLKALLAFPEWKKFSAQLPVQRERDLAFVLSKNDRKLADAMHSKVGEWRRHELLAKLTEQSARDIAFEVYMDQEVPDCH